VLVSLRVTSEPCFQYWDGFSRQNDVVGVEQMIHAQVVCRYDQYVLDVIGCSHELWRFFSHNHQHLTFQFVVSSRREGRQIFYQLNLSVTEEVMESLAKLFNNKTKK
jgi:hypothetical protein